MGYGHMLADEVEELSRLLEQEKFERQQLADAYKRDLVLLEQITQERDDLQHSCDALTLERDAGRRMRHADGLRVRELEAENNRLRGQVQEFQDRWDGLVKGGRDDEAVSMYNNGYVNSLIRERNSAEAVLQRIAGREWLSADVAEQMRAEARAATGWK